MRLSPYRVAVTSACLLLAAAFAGCGQPASAPPPAPAAAPRRRLNHRSIAVIG